MASERRKWLREAQKDVELVGDAEQSLERLRVEVAQLRGQLRVEEEEAKQTEAQTVSKKAPDVVVFHGFSMLFEWILVDLSGFRAKVGGRWSWQTPRRSLRSSLSSCNGCLRRCDIRFA